MKNRLFDLGKLRHRVAIYQADREDDGSGGFDRQDPSVDSKLGDYWARLEPVSAKERQWGEQFTELTTHTAWLRYNSSILPGSILVYRTVSHYVESVYDPDNTQEWMFLTLREGGPL